MKSLRSFIILSLIALVCQSASSQHTYNDSLLNGENYSNAAFRMWIPEGTEFVQGVFVLVPGSGYDGRDAVDDEEWQELAREWDFALMACYLSDYDHEHPEIEEYVDVKRGSGDAMLESLGRMAKLSGFPELDTVPLMLYGMSAGGQFNYEFACWKPERLAAFVVNKGGIYYTALAPPAAWEVPGLFFTGERDSPYRTDIVRGLFSMNRRFGAKWAYLQEPRKGHETGRSEYLAKIFFSEVIKMNYHMLSDEDTAYIGIIDSKKLVMKDPRINTFHLLSSWIVSKEFGDAWLEVISD